LSCELPEVRKYLSFRVQKARTTTPAVGAFKREDRNGRAARWESFSFGPDVAHQRFHVEIRAEFSDVMQYSSSGRRNFERHLFSGDLEDRLSSIHPGTGGMEPGQKHSFFRVHAHGWYQDWLRRDLGSYSKKFMNGIHDLRRPRQVMRFQNSPRRARAFPGH